MCCFGTPSGLSRCSSGLPSNRGPSPTFNKGNGENYLVIWPLPLSSGHYVPLSSGHYPCHLATTLVVWPLPLSSGHYPCHLATTYPCHLATTLVIWPLPLSSGHYSCHLATTLVIWPLRTLVIWPLPLSSNHYPCHPTTTLIVRPLPSHRQIGTVKVRHYLETLVCMMYCRAPGEGSNRTWPVIVYWKRSADK